MKNTIKRSTALSATLLLVPVLFTIYLSWLNRYYFFDDTMIYARYIKNLFNGDGLVYNKGEYFNGLTSPLFTYLSIATTSITTNVITSINFLSSIFLVGTMVMFQSVFNEAFNTRYAVIGSILLITTPYTYSVFGMETFLFTFLIAMSIYFFIKNRYAYLLTTLTMLVLTRNEGVFLIAAMAVEHIRLKRTFPPWKQFIIPSLLTAAHLSFNFSYYGAFMPHTGPAKVYQGMSGLWGTRWPIFLREGSYVLGKVFGSSQSIGFILTGISGIGIYHTGKNSISFISIIFLSLLLSFYCILNIPNYHWYNMPFVIFIFYYSSIGMCCITRLIIKQLPKIRFLLPALIITGVCYTGVPRLHFKKPSFPYIEIGHWLKENTKPEASIAMVEVGIVGYFSERPIIDILGLVTPLNAKYIGHRQFDKWLESYTPDYMLAHSPFWGHETSIKYAVAVGDYTTCNTFNIKGYNLFVKTDLNLSNSDAPKPLTSTIKNLKLKPIDTEINFYIDRCEDNHPKLINITGWAFQNEKTVDKTNKYIVLRNPDKTYIFSTITIPRKDVTRYFKARDLDNSGFEALILKKNVLRGIYHVDLLLIEEGGQQHLIFTNETVTSGKLAGNK